MVVKEVHTIHHHGIRCQLHKGWHEDRAVGRVDDADGGVGIEVVEGVEAGVQEGKEAVGGHGEQVEDILDPIIEGGHGASNEGITLHNSKAEEGEQLQELRHEKLAAVGASRAVTTVGGEQL